MSLKKLVILSSRFPYPLEKGDKLRLYHQLKYLHKHFDIYLLSVIESVVLQGDARELKPFCKEIKYFKLSRPRQATGLALNIFSRLPYQVRYFYDRQIKERMQEEIEKIKPDIIYCQLLRMAPYTSNLNYLMVIDYMDAFSLIMKRRYESSNGVLRKFFYKLEAKRLKRYEAEIQKRFSAKTIISNKDKAALSSITDLEVIANGVDTDYYQPKDQEKIYDLLFAGNMGYHPNVSAAKYLVKEIVKDKNLKVLIAGARPTHDMERLATKNITVSGWVEDIRTAYHESKIFIAPLFEGAGQQNKILQAMALGIPCITTSIVNDAIGAEDGKEVLVANDAPSFEKLVYLLLDNPQLRKEISMNARIFVEENYSWDVQNEKLASLISKQTI